MDDYAALVAEWDAGVAVSKTFGFFYDTSELGDFVSAYKNIEDKYRDPLLTGTIALDDVLPAIQSELTAIGFYDIIADMQAQLDAYLAEQAA